MNHLLRPRICPSFRASSVVGPATYRSGTPRVQHPAVARWHAHLHGLATAIHETSGLSLPASCIWLNGQIFLPNTSRFQLFHKT
jgi:hypothetical protein